MTKLAKMAGRVLPFAHLLGIKAAKAEDSEDDEDKKKDEAKAESDEDDECAEAEDGQEPERKPDEDKEKETGKKSKKAKAEGDEGDENCDENCDEDEEEDEEEEGKPSASVLRERNRCARIIAHGIKTGAVRQAGVLAFDTSMSAKAAIASLDAVRADGSSKGNAASTLASRMSGVATPHVRPDAGRPNPNDPKAVAAQILAAAAKARGETV